MQSAKKFWKSLLIDWKAAWTPQKISVLSISWYVTLLSFIFLVHYFVVLSQYTQWAPYLPNATVSRSWGLCTPGANWEPIHSPFFLFFEKTSWSRCNRPHWQQISMNWKSDFYFVLFLCQILQRQKCEGMDFWPIKWMLASRQCHIKTFLTASALIHLQSSWPRGSSFVLSLSANMEPIDGAVLSNCPIDVLKCWNQIQFECWTDSCPLSRMILGDPKDNFRRLSSWGCSRLHYFSCGAKEIHQNKEQTHISPWMGRCWGLLVTPPDQRSLKKSHHCSKHMSQLEVFNFRKESCTAASLP